MAQLHPAHRLCCWLLAVIAVQSLSGLPLALAFGLVPLAGRAVVARWARLAWRARWLLLSLLAVLAWGVAGEPVRADGGAWVPTWEGLGEGLTQLGRLLLVLAAVALLLETTPVERLMAGCHVLLRPLAAFRLDVDRAVVRLSLALHYAARMPKGGWKHLLDPDPNGEAPAEVTLALPPATVADWTALAAALVATAVVLVA
ncbi:CbiQ family ECF transporter T component [Azospira restricta]|uniref:Cobalt transport protein n=1 Tax=Azospira restricta TaxID=404405 RepID=A0A974PYL9_9RHOO|nr:CbiQ family ECF transporter T component [Azospira restricta]QRJ63380.1 hypothetical protein IWH25_16785 [Azospira restricta]